MVGVVAEATMVMIVARVVVVAMVRSIVAMACSTRALSRSGDGGKAERRNNRDGGEKGLEHQKTLGFARRESPNRMKFASKP